MLISAAQQSDSVTHLYTLPSCCSVVSDSSRPHGLPGFPVLHHLLEHIIRQMHIPCEGQGSLACCSPWGCKQSDMTWRLNKVFSFTLFSIRIWFPVLYTRMLFIHPVCNSLHLLTPNWKFISHPNSILFLKAFTLNHS